MCVSLLTTGVGVMWVFSHLFGFLHSIAGRVSDLWRRLGVDFIVELKQKDDNQNM